MRENSEYLTASELAKVFNVSRQYIVKQIQCGAIEAIKCGHWRISKDEVERIKEHGFRQKIKRSTYKNQIILNNLWYKEFGIVKCEDIKTHELSLFLGVCPKENNDEWTDICFIIDNGKKF